MSVVELTGGDPQQDAKESLAALAARIESHDVRQVVWVTVENGPFASGTVTFKLHRDGLYATEVLATLEVAKAITIEEIIGDVE